MQWGDEATEQENGLLGHCAVFHCADAQRVPGQHPQNDRTRACCYADQPTGCVHRQCRCDGGTLRIPLLLVLFEACLATPRLTPHASFLTTFTLQVLNLHIASAETPNVHVTTLLKP